MRTPLITAGATLAVLALAGCSSSSGHGPSSATAEHGAGLPPAAKAAAGTDRTRSAGGPAETGPSTQQRVLPGPALITIGEVTVRVRSGDDLDSVARRATSVVIAGGGQLTGDQRIEGGAQGQADLVFRILPAKFPSTLNQLAALGKEQGRTVTTEDVTNDVADVNSRVSSQQASVERVRALLSKARNLGEVVQIEGELARREADLESLQARQRVLDAQTSFATLTLHIRGAQAAVAKPAPPARGFLAGLHAGWRAFTAGVSVLLTTVGALLPFLAVAAVLVGLVVALRRRRQSPVATSGPEPAPAP
ncbi:MAG: DUF4349 domain-containing protein [Actinomycetota bacterium]|nr:DUF4349 domain-containing protein [Actinomycetota bacterium]